MKFYLTNIKSLVLRYSIVKNRNSDVICSGTFDLIYHNSNRTFHLVYFGDDEEIITWLRSKCISFDRSQVDSNIGYKFNIELYGCHVILNDEDKEFILYKKLQGLIK